MADYTIRVRRFDPESGQAAYWQDFGVDLEPERSVLDAVLRAKWDEDGSLAIRCSCQAAICGSCGIRVNGKSALACNTKLGEAMERAEKYGFDRIVVEPMGNMPVIKDLIVDMDAVHWKKVQRVVPWLLPVGDPRDAHHEDRLLDLAEDPHGIYDCTHCFACVEVCPKDVAPMNQIMRLRRRATDDYGIKDSNNGYGHEKAFTNILERWGTLHEAQLLPRSFGDGSLVKGQTRPSAVAQLVDNLPTVVRGLRSGKVTPMKALLHKKLPDQNEVRRIFDEVESHDERIELNLYIIGELAEDEEGAMAEGSQEA